MALPEDVEPHELDPDARRELRSLTKEAAELVARHLVMTGRLVDEDPLQALAHARAARAMAARIGVVREAVGLTAYACEQWTEALAELRAARRITGRPEHLAVLADCERALSRPERALAYADDPDVPGLPQDERVELVIVLAGARADMGQVEAAVLMLQEPAQRTSASRPWATRLWYAFADLLAKAGRLDEAREWFIRTADADTEGATDAGDRVLELDGVVVEDLLSDDANPASDVDPELADYIRQTWTGTSRAQDPGRLSTGVTPSEVVTRVEGKTGAAVVAAPPFTGATGLDTRPADSDETDGTTSGVKKGGNSGAPDGSRSGATDGARDGAQRWDAEDHAGSGRPASNRDDDQQEPLRLFE